VVNGTAVYDVWWEMYSSGKQQPEQVVSSMTIEPGDSISASVQFISSGAHAGDFYLTITDNSRPDDSFSIYVSSAQTQSPTAEQNSAEWIVESPTVGNNVADLANFGTVTFTSASATINGVTGSIGDSAWQSQAINIASGSGSLEDTTSTLVDSGSSFTVTYDASSAAPAPGRFGWFSVTAASKDKAPSSGNTIRSSAAPPRAVLFYGTTLTSQPKRPTFGVGLDALWS
jgi:hypothetical protein